MTTTRSTETDVSKADRLPASIKRSAYSVAWTDDQGSHTEILHATMTVGSSRRNPLIIASRTVSRLHARIEVRDSGELWVRDLGSRNGTYVNEVPVEHAALVPRATLRLGAVPMRVVAERKPLVVIVSTETSFGPLVGRSSVMRELFELLTRAARTDSSVLVEGETGVGKEAVARAIHQASPRADGPFVIVDCAALSESLVEAELFGHTGSAFTGAGEDRAGAIESAHGGTLLLDEVGELPLEVQQRLLRAVDARMVRRLGESRYREVDVRIVSTTRRNLGELVNQGAFREDLYFRLAVLPVHVPPLRERLDDIPLLIAHFLQEWGEAPLPAGAVETLTKRGWAGNVRELRNVLERVRVVGVERALKGPTQPFERVRVPVDLRGPYQKQRDDMLATFEREYIGGLMRTYDRSVQAVANASGLSEVYVRKLVKRHGV